KTVSVLSQGHSYSIIVDLDETDSIIIKGKTYRKLMKKESQVEKSDELIHNVQTANTVVVDENEQQNEISNNKILLQIDELLENNEIENKIISNKEKQTENEMINEECIILDDNKAFSLLNNEDNILNKKFF
ncbi:7829_t:CDS:2, partial [Gigaspora margarita]